MTESPTLSERVRQRFDTLSAKQQQVARILAEEPSSVVLSSVNDLAACAGVDAATVVRTCQSLGYSGWRELLVHLKADLTRQRTFAERVAELGGQEQEDLIAQIRRNACRNVDDTFSVLDDATLRQVAQTLSRAGTVMVAAGGASAGAGEYLSSSLQIIGVRSTQVIGVSDAASTLGTLHEDDVVVGISLWRYLRSTVEILRHARESVGATTVVLTDSAISSATRYADHTLVASTNTLGPRLSIAGLIALIEALVAHTALADPERSRTSAARASDFYFDGHVLADPAPRRDGEQRAWQERLDGELDHG